MGWHSCILLTRRLDFPWAWSSAKVQQNRTLDAGRMLFTMPVHLVSVATHSDGI